MRSRAAACPLRSADPSAATEVEGLIPSAPARRPADILTSAALPGSLAALDIGVKAPDATGAGTDRVEAMRQEKVAEYAGHLEELGEQNVVYRPLAFSAFGRVHPDATVLLTNMAKRAARRRGLGDHRSILRRAMAKVGVQIWRRAASMVRACLPRLTEAEAAILFGDDPAAGADGIGGDADGAGADGLSAARAGTGLVTAGGNVGPAPEGAGPHRNAPTCLSSHDVARGAARAATPGWVDGKVIRWVLLAPW